MSSKKILTIIYLNRSIALAKVSFSGKTANVSNYSEFALPEGTIENAIVYDPRTVSGIVKEYINAVDFKQIDKTVACVPDNKVKIIFYKYDANISESQNEDDLTNLVEKEMNTAMQNLSVMADTFTMNGDAYTVIYAIRREILDPYMTASRFGASIFPASLALAEALSKNLVVSTIVFYPRGNSLRFFIWSNGRVIANSVDGRNVLDIDNNLSYGVREVISYGETLIQHPIEKVLFIEGKKVSRAEVEKYLDDNTGFEVEFFRTKDATLDQYKFLALKGLIKKINETGLEKPSIRKRIITDKKTRVAEPLQKSTVKIAVMVTVIVALIVGLLMALLWTYYDQSKRKVGESVVADVTPTTVMTTTNVVLQPDFSVTSTPVVSTTPPPITSTVTPAQTTVKVLNGTGTAGEAKSIADVISSMGFPNVKTGDQPPYDTAKAIVKYVPGYETMADQIIDKLKSRFPLISKQQVSTQDFNVIVVTGRR